MLEHPFQETQCLRLQHMAYMAYDSAPVDQMFCLSVSAFVIGTGHAFDPRPPRTTGPPSPARVPSATVSVGAALRDRGFSSRESLGSNLDESTE